MRRGLGWYSRVVVRDWACAVRLAARAAGDRTPVDALAHGLGTPVVVLPGVWESWRFLLPLARRLNSLGHPVHFVPGLGWNGRPLDASREAVLPVLKAVGRPVVLVAHSKGGLLGKSLLALQENSGSSPRIMGLVALGTPFNGSSLSVRVLGRTALGMFAPGGPDIRGLDARRGVNHRIVSAGGPWDEMVPDGVLLRGAHNPVLGTPGHFLPLVEWSVVEQVHGWVEDLAADRPDLG